VEFDSIDRRELAVVWGGILPLVGVDRRGERNQAKVNEGE
jgi:hypothetical protein